MKFAKALCVVLLFYSASFGESRTLENVSNPKKRVSGTTPKSPKAIAQEVEMLVRNALGQALSGGQQFGYVYIQPFESDDVTFDDSVVRQALNVDKKLPSTATGTVWPESPDNTNFRMAIPDYSKPKETNYGHSEYQLLKDDGLGKMLTTFNKKHECPQYVILYSKLLPCMYPPNPDPILRCADMTVDAKKELKGICPGANFFLYTTQTSNPNYPDVFDKTIKYFKKKGIFWINPNTLTYK